VQLDDVLRQDRDERHDRDHDAVADVELGGLRRPGEHKRRRDDRGAVGDDLQRVRRDAAGEPHQQARNRERGRKRDPLAQRGLAEAGQARDRARR
jgi:hypothetical protein